jgi:hypothetical protein
MDVLIIFELSSALIVLIALCYGSWTDIHSRTSPKWIWNIVTPFAALSTFCWYVMVWYWNGFSAILPVVITSAIFSLFCFVMAHHRSGGDWRALFYISVLTPWFVVLTLILACLVGFVQVGIDWVRKSPVKSAWLVSITVAFVISVVAKVFIL